MIARRGQSKLRRFLPWLCVSALFVVVMLLVASPMSEDEVENRLDSGHKRAGLRVDMNALIDKAPIYDVAESVGPVITVFSPEYERAKLRARRLAREVRETREYQIDISKYLWQYNR